MLIKKKLEIKKRKQGFFDWVLFHPQAFAITFRMALIMPIVLMGAWLIWSIGSGIWVSIGFSAVFFIVSIINLIKNRAWFKTQTTDTIGGTIFNKGGQKKKSYDEFLKELEDEKNG